MLDTKEKFQTWIAEGERLAWEFQEKADSTRNPWVRRNYRRLVAQVRAEIADAQKEFPHWA